MKKIKCFIGVISIAILLSAPADAAKKKVFIENQYKHAYELESLATYGQARREYRELCKKTLNQLRRTEDPMESISMIPVGIGSAVRLAEVVGKDTEFSARQLTEQIEAFKEAHNIIESMLTLLIDLRLKQPDVISKYQYETILMARAYNQIRWANKMALSIPWKNYIVVPITDIDNMVRAAVADLDRVMRIEEISVSTTATTTTQNLRWFLKQQDSQSLPNLAGLDKIRGRWQKIEPFELEYHAQRLIYLSAPGNQFIDSVLKNYQRAYEIVYYYRQPETQQIVAHARTCRTLNEIVEPENKSFYAMMARLESLVNDQPE